MLIRASTLDVVAVVSLAACGFEPMVEVLAVVALIAIWVVSAKEFDCFLVDWATLPVWIFGCWIWMLALLVQFLLLHVDCHFRWRWDCLDVIWSRWSLLFLFYFVFMKEKVYIAGGCF